LIQVVDEEYNAGFDARWKFWCEQSSNIYDKLYSEYVIIDMHNNRWDLYIELYRENKNNTF